MANVKGEYKFHPGICPSEYQTRYFSKIRYDVKNVRRTKYPFEQIDSSDCLMFHKLAKNASIIEKGLECVPCYACKRLVKDLSQGLAAAASWPDKIKRQQPSSHSPLKYMSPTSQKKRKDNTQRERAKNLNRLQKFPHTELTLSSTMSFPNWWRRLRKEEKRKLKKSCRKLIAMVQVQYEKSGKWTSLEWRKNSIMTKMSSSMHMQNACIFVMCIKDHYVYAWL